MSRAEETASSEHGRSSAKGDFLLAPGESALATDETHMARAIELAQVVRTTTSPNPWVGCVIVDTAGEIVGEGATAPLGGPHAEAAALAMAGEAARGATCYVTLEPCTHQGRTPPCTEALVRLGVARVVAAIGDPDPKVAGAGFRALEEAGVLGIDRHARRHGERPVAPLSRAPRDRPSLCRPQARLRPWTAGRRLQTVRAGGSRAPRRGATSTDLRAESDAVLVGAETVRQDDPELTVRSDGVSADRRQPLRVVLGHAPADARVQPALELGGDLGAVLDDLGRRDVLQLLVEGGAHVAAAISIARGLSIATSVTWRPCSSVATTVGPCSRAPACPTMSQAWRGRLVSFRRLGDDLRIDLEPIQNQLRRLCADRSPGPRPVPRRPGSTVDFPARAAAGRLE